MERKYLLCNNSYLNKDQYEYLKENLDHIKEKIFDHSNLADEIENKMIEI